MTSRQRELLERVAAARRPLPLFGHDRFIGCQLIRKGLLVWQDRDGLVPTNAGITALG